MKRLEEIKRRLVELREIIRNRYKAEVIGIFDSYFAGSRRREATLMCL
jgi:predicted nucleotidyltransferase